MPWAVVNQYETTLSAGLAARFKSDVELHELAVLYVLTESFFCPFQDGLPDVAFFVFVRFLQFSFSSLFLLKITDKPTRGQSFRGYYRGRGRSTGRGRSNSLQRSFPHPRSHLRDDDEDIDMDGGRQRSVARL